MRLIKLLLVAALVAPGVAAAAENGAAGWLRYAPVRNPGQYRSIPSHVVALDDGLVIQNAANEAARGLSRMLGRPILEGQASSDKPEIVIGTGSEIQSRFPGWKPLAQLKPEGYAVTTVRDHDRTDWIIAGAGARGALYGTFRLLEEIGEEKP